MAIRKWTWMAGVIAAMVVASPKTALAQEAPGGCDEVTLKNGGVLRGTVVAMEPDKEVVIQIKGLGEVRRVPWAEVERVNRGESAPAGGVTVLGLPLPGLPPPLPAEVGAPLLHIESDQPVSLHEATVSLDGRRRPIVCRTPCDTVVDGRTGRSFFFAGDEVPESSRFLLTEKSGRVSVHVSTGNDALRTAGSTFLVFGIMGAAAGTVLLPAGFAINASHRADVQPGLLGSGQNSAMSTHASPLPLVGGVMIGAGVAVLTAGIVMKVFGSTRYEFTSAGVRSALREPGVIRF